MLRLCTFGSVNLEGPPTGDLSAVLAQPKRLALLVYLAAARPFGVHRRDELLALFWPDLDDTRARDALNQALRFLRQALGPDVFVRRGGEDVGIDPARLWCDAAAFHSALDAERPADALELYRGDFLQGFFIEEGGGFEEWLERERVALRELAAKGARDVAESEANGGGFTQAIAWGRRALELAPDDERALRRLLRWYDRAGDRAGAFRQYEAFARRFQEAFAAEPSADTKKLVEALRAGRPLPEEAGSRRPAPGSKAPDPDQFSERYRIERKLGAGGMATVFLATDLKHDREVALKVLKPEVAAGLARERFIREIRIAGRLQHPNIVPLFDSGEAKGQLFFVMPHVQGENLRERLRREGKLELDAVVHILREVAQGLAYAHQQGIVHRDIKPENILLIDRRAVLTDFGIARAAQAARTPSEEFDPTLTQPGTSLGTPAYMSPEQASASDAVDHRTDLYALGAVGYEMLAGRTPFSGETAQALLVAQITEQPEPLAILRPDVPPGLERLILHCLEKHPSHRVGSASSFLSELDGEVRTERPPSRGIPSIRSKPLRWVAVALLLLATAGIVPWLWPFSAPADDPSQLPGEATQVAVRPLADLSPDRGLGHVAAGLTLDLVSELARIPVLRVRSATVMTPFERATPDSIRRALGVGTLIEGSVAGEGDSLRITAAIVLAGTGNELSRQKWIVSRSRLLAIQDSLVAEIGAFIRDRLGAEIRTQQGRLGTRNARSWEQYQIGTATLQEAKRLFRNGEVLASENLMRVADSLLQEAESGDPRWTDPGLARGWLQYWRGLHAPAESLQSGIAAQRAAARHANRMLEKRANLAEALELRGTALLQVTIAGQGDSASLAAAQQDLTRAANPANPFQARAWNTLSFSLRWQGRAAEANVAARRAYDLDPFLEQADQLLAQLCSTSFELNQLNDAQRWCDEGRRRFARSFEFPYYLLQIASLRNPAGAQPDSAWALFREMERNTAPSERPTNQPAWQLMVAAALATAGLEDSARRVVARAAQSTAPNADIDVYAAAALVALGDREAAFDRLRAYLLKNPVMRPVVRAHPSFARVSSDPRFRDLVAATARAQ